jgi:toxin FitB
MVTAARPNIVDSSGWLAYLADEPEAAEFAGAIENTRHLVVPTICVVEVFKVVAREAGESEALRTVAAMQRARVVDLDPVLAIRAAQLGLEHRLPLAGSIVYATAREAGGVVWTCDSDFQGLPNVHFVAKRPR